jgi:hypothetical protein
MNFPISYFGAIPYFQEFVKYKEITILAGESYQKQTWRNRMEILTGNGPLKLSIPVSRPFGKQSKLSEVEIVYSTNWQKDHWKAIESSYMHAPYFFYYKKELQELYYRGDKLLIDFNLHILDKIMNWLDLPQKIKIKNSGIENKQDQYVMDQLNQKNWHHFDNKTTYIQVFSDKLEFHPNLSILDLILNEGPIARKHLLK